MLAHADDAQPTGLDATFIGVAYAALIVGGLLLLKLLGGKRVPRKRVVSD
jgi:hypothetical protein